MPKYASFSSLTKVIAFMRFLILLWSAKLFTEGHAIFKRKKPGM